MPDSDKEKDTKVGIDALEKLANLIAEEFVNESRLQLAEDLLTDPALRAETQEPQPNVRAAGSDG